MTTDLTSDIQLTGISANLSALQGLLRDAATRGTEALNLIQHSERHGAIGALVGLDAALDNADALYGAALALHRVKTTAALSSSVCTPVLTAQDFSYLRHLAEAEHSLQRESQHLPVECPEGILDRLATTAPDSVRDVPLTPDGVAIYGAREPAGQVTELDSTEADTRDAQKVHLTLTPPDHASDKDSAHRLIDTINNTGGLVAFANGTYGPQCDPDWLDLGDAYLAACNEKGVEPRVARDVDPGQPELPV